MSENLKKQLEENQFEKELVDEYQFSKAKVKELTKFVSCCFTEQPLSLFSHIKGIGRQEQPLVRIEELSVSVKS